MKLIDRKGIQFRLYLLFVGFSVLLICIVWFIQLFNVKQRLRDETINSLQNITWNISSTYGTDAYYKAMRAAAFSGEYLIKTMTEDGVEMEHIGITGLDIEWPKKITETDDLIIKLDHSNGYIDYEVKDENTSWIVHAQVIASWQGKREIIFVAQSSEHENQQIKSLIIQLLESSVFVIIISLIIAWIFSKKFLKPITEVTNSAKKLAKGVYKISFPKNTYTEINLLSDTLERAAKEFADYEKIRRDLIANVSHDMRTPLTMIKAYAELILTISGNEPEKREQHLKIIIKQSDKLSEFVNLSLDLAKLQSKDNSLQITRFSLGKLVNEMISHLKVIYKDKVEFDISIESKYLIKADKVMMEQVIHNFIVNAIRYSDSVIHIKVKKHDKKVMFEIIDHGQGIAKLDLGSIWIKYYKVNRMANDNGSTGVGLSIIKEILELHGFDYGVESTLGKGSRFWFTIE